MPNPKGTGAPMVPQPVMAPGSYGVNTQNQLSALDSRWASKALNFVIDDFGALTTRKGMSFLGSGAATNNGSIVDSVFAWVREGEALETNRVRYVFTTQGTVSGTASVGAYNPVSGAYTVNNAVVGAYAGVWSFAPFADDALYISIGPQVIKYDGTTFTDVAGLGHNAHIIMGAFGRMWHVDINNNTIYYSVLLGPEDFAGNGSGTIDMTSVWPNGSDSISGLAAYNGMLVIFGHNSIVFYGDDLGSTLGLNPLTMYVLDTVVGTGCVSHNTIQEIENGDLLFLSDSGLRSLSRTIQEKSNPMSSASMNVRDDLIQAIKGMSDAFDFNARIVKGTYDPNNGFYLLTFPNTYGLLPFEVQTYCFNTKGRFEDGSLRATQWDCKWQDTAYDRLNKELIILPYIAPSVSVATVARLGKYSGQFDANDAGQLLTTEIRSVYKSGWLASDGETFPFLKFPKQLAINCRATPSAGEGTLAAAWSYDFKDPDLDAGVEVFTNTTVTNDTKLQYSMPLRGFGQFIQLTLAFDFKATLHNYTVFHKLGRYAR